MAVHSTRIAPGLDAFMRALRRQRHTDRVYNPYRHWAQCANLRRYIEAVTDWSHRPILLVGEAPGYLGCRSTGIPFSSGRLFAEPPHPFIEALSARLDSPGDDAENTATLVWSYLAGQCEPPLFWNAYPYHPHRPDEPRSNRAPTATEVRAGQPFLHWLDRHCSPRRIAGLGRKGAEAARRAWPDREIAYIRHPSYGGKWDFIRGMNALMNETCD